MEKDPICGMLVKTGDAAARSEYQGKHYFFCAVTCKETFDRNPQRYVVKKLIEEETASQVDKTR